MQRTLIIHTGERLIKRENWLVLQSERSEKRIPIDDLFCVVIDNPQMVMSTALMTAITGAGGHVLFCDERHCPWLSSARSQAITDLTVFWSFSF